MTTEATAIQSADTMYQYTVALQSLLDPKRAHAKDFGNTSFSHVICAITEKCSSACIRSASDLFVRSAMLTASEGTIDDAMTLIVDAAVGCVLERVDAVLLGAESVVESGDIINKIGTYTMAMCAKEKSITIYVLTESIIFFISQLLLEHAFPKSQSGNQFFA
ncbi:uncharacterized protein LOC142775035 [Rhipicephalus microplus]|uniref:uncharacterized protein LOC142775035 n=1 Tax=Rhipicephalus microplus TaxID=6941 RepID=UPI003F6C1C5B